MKCLICGDEWPDANGGLERANDHLRDEHPDQYGEGPERYADGSIVVYMPDIEPEDITGGSDA